MDKNKFIIDNSKHQWQSSQSEAESIRHQYTTHTKKNPKTKKGKEKGRGGRGGDAGAHQNMNNPRAIMFGKKGHVVHTNITKQMEEATDSKQKRGQLPHGHWQIRNSM